MLKDIIVLQQASQFQGNLQARFGLPTTEMLFV